MWSYNLEHVHRCSIVYCIQSKQKHWRLLQSMNTKERSNRIRRSYSLTDGDVGLFKVETEISTAGIPSKENDRWSDRGKRLWIIISLARALWIVCWLIWLNRWERERTIWLILFWFPFARIRARGFLLIWLFCVWRIFTRFIILSESEVTVTEERLNSVIQPSLFRMETIVFTNDRLSVPAGSRSWTVGFDEKASIVRSVLSVVQPSIGMIKQNCYVKRQNTYCELNNLEYHGDLASWYKRQ